ncbi:MAG: NADH-quinone oxidoreductase subunit B family protein [Candidatus Bathyarchaeia archaeon]
MGLINWARRRSPWLLHFNTGGCNACDIEVVAALTPRYDVERFGALLVGSPRHADIMVVTGAITRQVKKRLLRVYKQMPEPKFVVAIGNCCLSGAVYRGAYNVQEGLDTVLPVDAYVYGCPPKPEAILKAIFTLQEKIKSFRKTQVLR